MQLTLRARLTRQAHLFKAITRQHHGALRPAFARLVPRDGVILDVGAHAGQFTKLFSRLAPAGRVYAVEPGSYAYGILETVIRVHRLRNVVPVRLALGDEASTQRLHLPIKASGSIGFGLSSLGSAGDGRPCVEEAVEQTTVDALVAAQGIDRLSLIKADIEGWELRLLKGARETLTRCRPVLHLEVARRHLARAGDTPGALWRFLEALDYRGHLYDATADGFAPAGPGGDADVFFVPQGRRLPIA